ncbi:DUF308 domain-containing protein [Streptomyces mexicanus]
MTESLKSVWLLAARGGAAVVFGALTLVWPQLTVLALAWVFGAYALVDGVVLMGSAWRHRHERRPRWSARVPVRWASWPVWRRLCGRALRRWPW